MAWAFQYTVPGTKRYYNGFLADDCTDFTSRALSSASGGNLPEDLAPQGFRFLPQYKHNDKYWYQYSLLGATATSSSWANSGHMGDFFNGQGAFFLRHIASSQPGYIAIVDWDGSQWYQGIDHLGIITVVNGTGIYITQHSPSQKNVSLFRQGRVSWYGKHPHLTLWIVIPVRQG